MKQELEVAALRGERCNSFCSSLFLRINRTLRKQDEAKKLLW